VDKKNSSPGVDSQAPLQSNSTSQTAPSSEPEKKADPQKPVESDKQKTEPAKRKERAVEQRPIDADPRKFGEHVGITCDGCETIPIIGFRYRCLRCKDSQGQFNHDICENCFEDFKRGELNYATQGQNRISPDPLDHEFQTYVDRKQFKSLSAGSSTPGKVAPGPKKTKPNEACPCGSGKKYKKCCANKTATV